MPETDNEGDLNEGKTDGSNIRSTKSGKGKDLESTILDFEKQISQFDSAFENEMKEFDKLYDTNKSQLEINDYDYLRKEMNMPEFGETLNSEIEQLRKQKEASLEKDRVLVPGNPQKDKKDRILYVTLDEYKEKTKLEGDALKEDLDKKAILIKSNSGTYLTKNQTYNTTYVDKSLSKDEQDAARKTAFKERMDELGLSDKSFASLNPEKLTADTRKYETPGGTRRQQFNYEYPVQAGRDTPDVLVKRPDGKFVAMWPKLEELKTLDDMAAKAGGRENVLLKTSGNSYVPADTFNERKGNLAAEKAYAKTTDTTLHLERNDMPKAFYKVGEGFYVAKEKYDELTKNPAYQGKIPENRKDTEILFQAPSGQGLVTGKTLKFLDKEGYKQTFENEGLPENLKTRRNVTKPEALVYLEKENVLISSERAKTLAQGKPLDEVYAAKDIYLQNKGKNGEFTGNYADKTSFERNNPRGVVTDRLATAGISESKEAGKIGNAYSSANIDKGLPPLPSARQMDHRSRTEGRDARE